MNATLSLLGRCIDALESQLRELLWDAEHGEGFDPGKAAQLIRDAKNAKRLQQNLVTMDLKPANVVILGRGAPGMQVREQQGFWWPMQHAWGHERALECAYQCTTPPLSIPNCPCAVCAYPCRGPQHLALALWLSPHRPCLSWPSWSTTQRALQPVRW